MISLSFLSRSPGRTLTGLGLAIALASSSALAYDMAITNSASYSPLVAPDSLASAWPYNGSFGSLTETANPGGCAQTLGERRMRVDTYRDGTWRSDYTCLLYVSPTQINFHVLPTAREQFSSNDLFSVWQRLVVEDLSGQETASAFLYLRPLAPAIFIGGAAGQGNPAGGYTIRVANGVETVVGLDQPIDPPAPGEVVDVVVYATGLRNLNRGDDVFIALDDDFAELVDFSEATERGPGVERARIRLPESAFARSGTHRLTFNVLTLNALGLTTSNTVDVTTR